MSEIMKITPDRVDIRMNMDLSIPVAPQKEIKEKMAKILANVEQLGFTIDDFKCDAWGPEQQPEPLAEDVQVVSDPRGPRLPIKEIKIEDMFEKFFKNVGTDVRKQTIPQLVMQRRAFYGGMGQLIVLMRDELVDLPDGEPEQIVQGIMDQCTKYFEEQTRGLN